jgi:hypothetical protein
MSSEKSDTHFAGLEKGLKSIVALSRLKIFFTGFFISHDEVPYRDFLP